MTRLTALLDANILYPAPLRDIFLQLAVEDVFRAKWTSDIHREWIKEGRVRVPTVAPEDMIEPEAGVYDGLCVANIHRALSLVPAEVTGFFDPDTVHCLPGAVLRDFGTEYRSLT